MNDAGGLELPMGAGGGFAAFNSCTRVLLLGIEVVVSMWLLRFRFSRRDVGAKDIVFVKLDRGRRRVLADELLAADVALFGVILSPAALVVEVVVLLVLVTAGPLALLLVRPDISNQKLRKNTTRKESNYASVVLDMFADKHGEVPTAINRIFFPQFIVYGFLQFI